MLRYTMNAMVANGLSSQSIKAKFDEFANAAHRLRGAALSMGARLLAETAGRLYTAARASDNAACSAVMTILATHVELMVAEVPPDVVPRGP